MFCAECGTRASATAKFCSHCGMSLSAVAPAKNLTVSGRAHADRVTGGEVAGVRVSQVTARNATFQASVIQINLSDAQVAQLAEAQALPTEVQAGSGLREKLGSQSDEIASMRKTVDGALDKLAQAQAAGNIQAQVVQAGACRSRAST